VPHPPRLVVDVSVVPSWTGSLLARHDGPVTHNIAEALQALAVDIDSLVCIEGNPRKGDIEAIAKSLHKFGQRRPLVFRADTREVEAGNHTLLAARSLGWTHVAAFAEDDDEATAKAFALADNRTHELGENDDDEIDAWLAEIADSDLALIEAAGYEIDAVLAGLPNDADDFVPFGEVEVDRARADVEIPEGGAEPVPSPLDAYTRFADKAREEVVDPQAVNDPDVWVIFKFGDLRAKVPRKAFEAQFDRIFREAGRDLNEAGRQAVLALGFDEDDVIAARRGEREVKK